MPVVGHQTAAFRSLFSWLRLSRNRHSSNIFLLKLAPLLSSEFYHSDKKFEGRIKQVSQENRQSKAKHVARDVASLAL